MKKIKYLGFAGLLCSLLLTGCGSGSNKNADIHCTMKGEDGRANIYAYLTNDKVSSTDIEYSYDSLEEAENDCSSYKKNYEGEADVVCDGKIIYVSNYKAKDVVGLSKEEFIEVAQDDGFSCK